VPTYQYACTECEHRFEQFQDFADASLTDCPVCAGKLRKVYGSVGVVFKGSGFYRTDSRSVAAGSDAGTGKDSGTDKSDSGTPAKEAKPAAKETVPSTTKSSDTGSSSSASTSNGSSGSSSKSGSSNKPAPAAKTGR